LHFFFLIFSTISIGPPGADGVPRERKTKKTKKENTGKKQEESIIDLIVLKKIDGNKITFLSRQI